MSQRPLKNFGFSTVSISSLPPSSRSTTVPLGSLPSPFSPAIPADIPFGAQTLMAPRHANVPLPLQLITTHKTPTLKSPLWSQTAKLYYNFQYSSSAWNKLCSPPKLPTPTKSVSSENNYRASLPNSRKCTNNSPIHPTTNHMARLLITLPLPPHQLPHVSLRLQPHAHKNP
jgi:hypothetical protein